MLYGSKIKMLGMLIGINTVLSYKTGEVFYITIDSFFWCIT
jgi:hypothetical protein